MEQGTPHPKHHDHHHADHIARDAEAAANKRMLMNRLKTNTRFSSLSRAMGAIGGPLFAVSLTLVATSAMATGLASVAAVSWGVLAVGAAFTAISLAADYAAARSWQSNNIDTQEATAQSTGRHIAKELKKEGLCISTGNNVDCEENKRSDGKTWTQAVKEQQTQQAVR